jgi:hypothetical protein
MNLESVDRTTVFFLKNDKTAMGQEKYEERASWLMFREI